MIAGVCGGIGEYLNVDPTLVRLAFVLLTFASGIGILIYIIAAIIVPLNPTSTPVRGPPITLPSNIGQVILLILGLLLTVFGFFSVFWTFGFLTWNPWLTVEFFSRVVWPFLLIAGGILILVVGLLSRGRPK